MRPSALSLESETIGSLRGDGIRQILWQFEDRFDIEVLVQSVRSGDSQQALFQMMDAVVQGPHHFAEALIVFEMAKRQTPVPVDDERVMRWPSLIRSAQILSSLDTGLITAERAAAEANASLGFLAARLLDERDALELHNRHRHPDRVEASMQNRKTALDCLQNEDGCENELVRFTLLDSASNVLSAACALPLASAHRRLGRAMKHELFLAQLHRWIVEMGEIGERHPDLGGTTLAGAMRHWLWDLTHQGERLEESLAELLASRALVLDVLRLDRKGIHCLALRELCALRCGAPSLRAC